MRSAILSILSGYLPCKARPFIDNPIADRFYDLAQAIRVVTQNRGYVVAASRGQGRFAEIPWAGVRRTGVAPTFQEGIYLIYLFRGDMSGLYLAIALGVSKLAGALPKDTTVKAVIRSIRDRLPSPPNFTDEAIDLRGKLKLAEMYERAVVWSRFYDARTLPEETILIGDLQNALACYGRARAVSEYVEH
jgi:hypothetical protein